MNWFHYKHSIHDFDRSLKMVQERTASIAIADLRADHVFLLGPKRRRGFLFTNVEAAQVDRYPKLMQFFPEIKK